MKILKKLITPVLLLIVLIVVIIKMDSITTYMASFFTETPKIVISPSNEYTKKNKYLFLKPSTDFVPYSRQDLINVFYSIINNGYDKFTFYCPDEYGNCIEDVKEISQDNELLTHINNYTHPYNNFDSFKTIYGDSKEVTVEITRLYDDELKKTINEKVNSIIKEVITDDMDSQTKILTIHDYIINNSRYDVEKNQTGESKYHSNIAYGPLIEGYAICGGYADVMAIFLTKLGFDNYKIASDSHVWNAVLVDNKWLHLDLTWDDPVSEQGVDYLYHKYFLVNNDELLKADGTLNNHIFNKSIYLEFRN